MVYQWFIIYLSYTSPLKTLIFWDIPNSIHTSSTTGRDTRAFGIETRNIRVEASKNTKSQTPTPKQYGYESKPWYLVNPKIAGKWMFIPLRIVSIGIDPYPYHHVFFRFTNSEKTNSSYMSILLLTTGINKKTAQPVEMFQHFQQLNPRKNQPDVC